ncbi:MAG: hypothetical protein CL927_18385 [Deltaproteobacteria bacterium]|nr:hypothetical protein [Deltaproteobacteria bacterium]
MQVRILLISLVTMACSSAPSKRGNSRDSTTVPTSSDDGGTTDTAASGDTGALPLGPTWPGLEWTVSTPAARGMDADALELLAQYTFRENHNTQALAVFKDGYLVGEWYAETAGAEALVTTWSMAKSVTSALIGVGVREGLLSVEDTVGTHLPEWATGPNAGITLRHLLTMQSGLPEKFTEPNGIYLVEPDQLAYALEREPIRAPGERFLYVNEDSMVLGGVIESAFGRPTVDVVETELLEPLGMSAEWWVDGAGNALTYCCMDSTAQDLARFGLLYARGGEWNGTQIIPADFVADSITGHSYGGNYGLHWWLDAPHNAFAAIGLHGQYLWVKPDADLVVVRFGTYERMGEEAVRTGWNYHATESSGSFNPTLFARLITDALVE